ncbi:jagunal 1 [Cichlidogyrus casuarinus]|uniref:Jagunal 1 n=1 Tax=Cichlidogyrus casuarinus TaxID=1844966 RepID=A0ABD2Q4J4_9PLAT
MVKVLPEVMLKFGYKTRLFFSKWPFPRSELWEYMWCFGSIPPIIFGYYSLNRNRLNLIRISLIGVFAFGLFPICWGSIAHAQELVNYYYTRSYKYNLSGFPIIIMLYIFFSICIQIHGFSLYFGLKLSDMWNTKKHR